MKTVKIDDFKNYNFLSGLKFSDDGRYLAYLLAHADFEDNDYKKALFVMDMQTKKSKQLTAYDVSSFLAFKGEEILFTAKRTKKEKESKEKTFVYSINVNGGEASLAYTFDMPVLKIEFVDNNKKTALVLHYWQNDPFKKLAKDKAEIAKKEDADYEVLEEIPFWRNGASFESRKRSRLYLYNLSSMKSLNLIKKQRKFFIQKQLTNIRVQFIMILC